MKKRILASSIGILLLLGAMPAMSASEAGVTATVTPQVIAVTVTDGSVAYGTLASNASSDTTSNGIDESQTITNTGNVTQDFNISGTNSDDWTLAATAGADQYVHAFCTTDCDTTPTFTVLTLDPSTLVTSVAPSGTQVFDLRITTPTSTTATAEQNVNVTVQAVAGS